MTTILFVIATLGIATAFSKSTEELLFKRLYIDPLEPVLETKIPRITHGHEAVPHSIPFQAYIIIRGSSGSWLCGGSLISPSYVLTAGHCVDGASTAEVYLGSHNIEMPESSRVLIVSDNLTVHEGFDASAISNDIGLIGLPRPVVLNKNINVVSLPSRASNHNNYEGRNARVSGWGLTIGGGRVSPVLQEVNSTVISNKLCDSYYGRVEDYQICISGDGGVGSCNGDSGGPLVVGNEQIGLVSYGVLGCMPGYPSGFTRTASFLDWLEQHTDLKF